MKAIRLVLTSPRGDELGRLGLGEIAVAAPGERGAALRPSLAEEMEELTQQIRTAIAQEGMSLDLDPIDFRIAISRALLEDSDREEIRLVLPVRETLPPDAGRSDPWGDGGGDDPLPLADLFPLDDLENNDEAQA